MAYAIIDDMGLRGAISNIRTVVHPNGRCRVSGTGGKATDVEHTGDTLAFTWTANSLPWVVPAEAQLGSDLLKLGRRASREGMDVYGLRSGKYEVSIDGQVVATYTDVQLARGIELQSNSRTPQYQQASQVAKLNKLRNQDPIAKLRGEWSQFQRFSRLRRRAKESPEDAGLAAQLADLGKKIEGMDDRIANHEAAAKEIEDKIFQINQPEPRRYVLQRVEE
jgi:hypothetical protein